MTDDVHQDNSPIGAQLEQQGENANALVRFGASPDRMKVCVSGYSPPRGTGRPLTVDMLGELLRLTGVKAPLDSEAAARVVEELLAGGDPRQVVIARGRPPTPAKDGWVEPLADLSLPVLPGAAFARLHPPARAQAGRNVLGEPVEPDESHKPRAVALPEGCLCAQGEGGVLTATAYGLARVEEDRVLVEPLLRIAEDRLTALAAIHHKSCLGREVTLDLLVEELARQGVAVGVDPGRLEGALSLSRAEDRWVENVVAAEGRPPVHGRNGRLEVLHAERSAVGTLDEHGRMDFRDRGYSPVVSKGEDVARLHQPTPGVPGLDVFGQEVEARQGGPLEVKPGPNVEVVEDGSLFRALIDGVVLASKNGVDVSELLDVQGDVDLSTGNLIVRKGSIRIRGTVHSGFVVEAAQSVLVGGMVENARIVAGGDVNVRGGIVMSDVEKALVQAQGAVVAAFTQNARVVAGGDVTVAHYISCSDVTSGYRVRSGGFVRVTDSKGRIMGGAVICAEGLEVYEAGSDMGVETVLALSLEDPDTQALVERKREIKANLDRLLAAIGEDETVARQPKLSAERRAEVKRLVTVRDQTVAKLRRAGKALARHAQERLAGAGAVGIVVRGTAHQGVVVKMGGRRFQVEQPLKQVRFTWDPSRLEIKPVSL